MGRERLIMTLTVSALALTILSIFIAYFAFSQDDAPNQDEYAHAGSVRMVAAIFRHGERLPTSLYPNDPHKNHRWPGAFGSLTLTGSKQLYNVGQSLRRRYKKLLPSDGIYSSNNMYVLSSAAERCLMSAQAFLAGFLVPEKSVLPISWQPVAVNSLPRDRDNLLAQKMACPKYDKMLKEYYENPSGDLLELNQRNEYLFKFLTEKTGLNVTNVAKSENIFNTLYIEHSMGLPLPDWTIDIYPEKLLALAERNLALLTETIFMMKVKGGALVSDILKKFEQKVTQNLMPDRNLLIYSAHDVTLVNVMRALNISTQTSRKPDYGATLVFELHQGLIDSRPEEFSIKIFYYGNSSITTPINVQIPSYGTDCAFEKFKALTMPIYVDDYEENCKL